MTETAEMRITYPRAWEEEYRRTRTVRAWNEARWFHPAPHSTQPGTLDLFAQYALMHLLAEAERMQALTWFYLAHVGKDVVSRLKAGEPWTTASPPRSSTNAEQIGKRWQTMRRYMGADFDTLQQAVVRAGFTGFTGEPDLFCYEEGGTRWFFAEAKGTDQLGDRQANPGATGWFDVSRNTLGEKGRVRVYRLVAG